ncbi:MAG TPA: hypothetical protein VGA08_03655, partial [Candidatus Saccharimonadales bacterium]
DGLSQLDVWAVAAQGEIYHYDGVSWSEVADTGNQTWYDLAVVTADNIWLVGNSGRVGHFNGSAWVEVEDFGNMDWRSVVFSNPDNGWMFGGNGEVYMYDGVNWSQFIDTGDQTWYGATLIGTTDGWAVGSGGSLLRYQSGGGFAASGNLTSSAYFMGGSASVHILDWNESNPCAGCDIQFQVRTAPDNGGTPGSWTDWSGSGGSGTYFTNPTGELISTDLNFNDWAQYRLELTGNGNDSPVLNGVRIYYLP